MTLSRTQFTLRRMQVLVLVAAILLVTGQWAYRRFAGPMVTRVYYVGDLIQGDRPIQTPATPTELSNEARLLRLSVTPDVWWLSNRSVTPGPLSLSLIVRHSASGHKQVQAWFRQRRDRLRDAKQ